MKHIQLTIKLISVFTLLILLNSCGEKLEGTFYISDEAGKYQIDTTITTMKFVDNLEISETFYMDQNTWYTTHHYFSEWGTNGKAWGETFGVAYNSTVNRFSFMFVLRADVDHTDLEIEWNQRDRLVYNFTTKSVESGVDANIKFYDTLTVRGIKYQNIIEVDYTEKINEIDNDTPVKTYISGNKGLIKFERKDKIILERTE
ncbi:MAG: hypothetical protein CSA36_04330 [Draconibacterium sp.]|nr:MAG: hypothetical protein CSA36_04330 [Draconibacterium sp.]